jgi:hypothetical protein
LQGGERKRHTVWLSLSRAGCEPALAWIHAPAVMGATSEWHADSQAWPVFIAETLPLSSPAATVLAAATSGPTSLLAKREVIDEYGWRNYGDVWADHEQDHFAGVGPVLSHYNNQFDLLYGALAHGVRTGDDTWWQVAAPLAQHVVDIDIYHTRHDRAQFNGGLFWHTDHYVSAGTATHRTYSAANASGRDYGGGPCNEHNYAAGLAHYHYLTGDPSARQAVIGLGTWVLASDDGQRSRWSLLDSGPTGSASRTYQDDFHGPGRGAGNAVQVLVDAWELTGEQRYLKFAETLIRRCVHPHDKIEALGLLDAERRWSYTVFLVALDRYLAAKQSAGQCDEHYAYAQQSLLAYARWMLANERPYLDRASELQYVTETWPAQDLRKANVLRIAAAHADEALALRLCEKADDISRQAYQQLLSFPNFHAARAVSIVATEALREAQWREHPPQRAIVKDFADQGSPSRFEPSLARIRRRLKTPRGLLALLAHAAWSGCGGRR